jgi:uncharacterized repeat protein (TIGR02543 family)
MSCFTEKRKTMRNYLLLTLFFLTTFAGTFKNATAQNWEQTFTADYTKYGSVNANHGQCVSFSEEYLYVGGYNDGGTADNPYGNTQTGMGIVTIMQKTGSSWQTTSSYLKPSDSSIQKYFGYSVSTDGNYVVVGATESLGKGSVYIFEKPSGGWAEGANNEIAKLTASNGANYDQFGFSVSISGDIIVVGAPYSDAIFSDAGQTYLFVKPVTGWVNTTETAILNQASSWSNSNAGYSVCCENDVVVVGALKARISSQFSGAVYVYEKPLEGWTTMNETAALTQDSPITGSYLGYSVALSGNTIVVGAPGNPSYLSLTTGYAYIFEKSGENWISASQTARIYSSGAAARNYLGSSVAIQGDMIVAGEYGYAENAGALRIYHRPAPGWVDASENESINTTDGFSSYNKGISLLNGALAIGRPLSNLNAGGVKIYKYAIPVVQSKNITSTISSGTATINWTDGNASKHAVFISSGTSTGTVAPTDNHTYTANSTFGSGSSIMTKGPTFWYCVFNGTTHADGVTVTGLSANTTYRVMVCDYYGEPGSEQYLTTSNTNNPVNFTTGEILPEVTYSVVEKKLFDTNVSLEYNLNESATWYPCTNTVTSNVEFVPGKVKIRQASYPANEKLITTLTTPTAPSFTINYFDETTNEAVGTTVEYNADNNFETANISGEGVEIALTPGQDLYLRYIATASDLASDIQHLAVNNRPAASAFTIDYENETAYNIVATAYEYAEDEYFTNNLHTATSQYVPITPGIDLWFRRQATSGSFAGESYFLDIVDRPAAPIYSIDYVAEQTNETIPNTVQYTTDPNFQTGILTGMSIKINVTPGTNVYFKGTASSPMQRFATEISELNVPDRPEAPAFSIDFTNEATIEMIPDTYEFASNSTFTTGLNSGTNNSLEVNPGINLWFRKKASNQEFNFSGNSQALTVPARPSGPMYTIDYQNEATNEIIPTTVEYNSDNNFATPNQLGDEQIIAISPGTNYYFRYASTLTNFSSTSTLLHADARPAGPVFTINFTAETTNQTVSTNIEYNTDNNFATPNDNGNGTVIKTTPGTDIYFRQMASSSQFKSEISTLDVPSRNGAPFFDINYVIEQTSSMVFGTQEYTYHDAQFSEGGTQGTNTNVIVYPENNLYIRWKAQANSFASETYTLTAQARPQAPTNPIVDDDNNTFNWSFQSEYTSPSDYQFSTDNFNWQSCSTKPVNVGNIDLPTGGIQIRVAASNSEPAHFCSEALASEAPFTIEVPQYTLTLNISGSGSVTVNGIPYTSPVTVDENSELTIVATPISGWTFDGWSGDLSSLNVSEIITLNSNKTVTATFTKIPVTQYYLFLYITGTGTVMVNGEPYSDMMAFDAGTEITLAATPGTGWSFNGWSGDINSFNTTESVIMNRTKDIWVSFIENQPITYTLTLDIIGSGSVTVNGNPYNEPVVVEEGTELTLNASGIGDWLFSRWSGDFVSSTNPETITMNSNMNITVTFTEPIHQYSVTITKIGNGNVYLNGWNYQYAISFDEGTRINLAAIAEVGWHFVEWSGYLNSTETAQAFDLTEDVVLTATFGKDASTVPVDLNITNLILADENDSCFNAENVITVAGSSTTVMLGNGSTSTFIAGNSIRFLPGFHAQAGSTVDAHITTDGSFCESIAPSIVENQLPGKSIDLNKKEKIFDNNSFIEKSFKVYPNPGKGLFNVEFTNCSGPTSVCVINSIGKVVFQQFCRTNDPFQINLLQQPKGLYIISITNETKIMAGKIMIE